jgi:hypothetical protein
MPKKFKWRKSKSAKEQPLADQNHNTTGEEKRQISGDIYVRGELGVETKFPPGGVRSRQQKRNIPQAQDIYR